MKTYRVTLTGITPLLMHNDNLAFAEKVAAWQRDPGNKEMSIKGDDRSPAWGWLGSAYHDWNVFGIPSDNIMTLLREGGTKISTGKGQETYKRHTQAGIHVHDHQWPIYVNGQTVPVKPLWDRLMGISDPERFHEHLAAVEEYGFTLSVKRAKVGQSKHVRVRPMFHAGWQVVGSFMVPDEETSGLHASILQRVFEQAGSLVGLGDWRPSSPKASGTYGKFTFELEQVDESTLAA
jgi:hypothetical protein